MKKIIIIGLLIVLVVLFGALPLNILGKCIAWLGNQLVNLARLINFFGYKGIA